MRTWSTNRILESRGRPGRGESPEVIRQDHANPLTERDLEFAQLYVPTKHATLRELLESSGAMSS